MMRRCAAVSALFAMVQLGSAPLAAQATDPPYLSRFPTVERVKEAMKVADPRETALRQMGALWQLQEIIKQLSGRREFRGFTPDEGKLIGDYSTAHYYIGKAVDSTYPGPYGSRPNVSDNTPYRYMRTDTRFGIEGIETFALLPPAAVDQFLQSTGADKARWMARAKADSEAMIVARNAPQAGSGPPGSRTDPETMQIRRCVESGRSQMQCVMEGLGKSITGLVGAVAPGLKKAPIQGIRMSGVYPGNNKFALTFYNESVNLECADLVLTTATYTAGVTAEGIRISVATTPKPLLLTLRADGRLAGPGPFDFDGQIITGYQEGVRTWADGRTEPISRPIYAPATRRCNVAMLAASGPSPALGSLSTAPAAALNLVFGSPDRDAGKPAPVGARMSGEYGSQSALDLEFRPEGVVLGCREVTSLRSYTVQAQGSQALIRIANGGTPLDLFLGGDGRIAGSGSVRVDGRVVSGSAPNGDIAYAARSASCSLATLAPAAPQLSEAEMGAAAARASMGQPAPGAAAGPPPTGTLGPAAASIVMPAAGTGAVFQLENGLATRAGSPNPLAGQSFLLLDVPLDKIVKEAGIAQPAGLSAPKALEKACTTVAGAADCEKLVKAMLAHEVTDLRPDQTGIAQSPELPVGRPYYLFGTVITGGKKYTWHLALTAKPGWTKVTLSPTNSVPDR